MDIGVRHVTQNAVAGVLQEHATNLMDRVHLALLDILVPIAGIVIKGVQKSFAIHLVARAQDAMKGVGACVVNIIVAIVVLIYATKTTEHVLMHCRILG